MSRQMAVSGVVLAFAWTARADVVLTLTALTPEDQPGGYSPGTVVDFQVELTEDQGQSMLIRSVQLDFQASAPGLAFLDTFLFDCAAASGCAMYQLFPGYPTPEAVYTGVEPQPLFMFEIPLVLGDGQVQLPMAPGTYALDAVNFEAVDPNDGALIQDFCASPPCSPIDVIGAPLPLTVVPEPGTLALVGVGVLLLSRARRTPMVAGGRR